MAAASPGPEAVPQRAWPRRLTIVDAGAEQAVLAIPVNCSDSRSQLSGLPAGVRANSVAAQPFTVETIVCSTGDVVAEAAAPFRVWMRGSPAGVGGGSEFPHRRTAPGLASWTVPFDPAVVSHRAVVSLEGTTLAGAADAPSAQVLQVSLLRLGDSPGAASGRAMGWLDAESAISRALSAVEAAYPSFRSCNATFQRDPDSLYSFAEDSCPVGANSRIAIMLPLPLLRAGKPARLSAALATGTGTALGTGIAVLPHAVDVELAAAAPPSAPTLAVTSAARVDTVGPLGTTAAAASATSAGKVLFSKVAPGYRLAGADAVGMAPPQAESSRHWSSVVRASVPVALPARFGGLGVTCLIPEVALDGRVFDTCRRIGYDPLQGTAGMPTAPGVRGDGLALGDGNSQADSWAAQIDVVVSDPLPLSDVPSVPDLPFGREVRSPWLRLPDQNATSPSVANSAYRTGIGAHMSPGLEQALQLKQSTEIPSKPNTVDSGSGNIAVGTRGVRWSWLGLTCFRPWALAAASHSASGTFTNATGSQWTLSWSAGLGRNATAALAAEAATTLQPQPAPGADGADGLPLDEAAATAMLAAAEPAAAFAEAIRPMLPGWATDAGAGVVPLARWLRADPVAPSPTAGRGGGPGATAVDDAYAAAAAAEDALEAWTLAGGGISREQAALMADAPPDAEARGLQVRVPLLLDAASVYRVRFRAITMDLAADQATASESARLPSWCDCHGQTLRPATPPAGNGSCTVPAAAAIAAATSAQCVSVNGTWRAGALPAGPWRVVAQQSFVSAPSDVGVLVTPAVPPGAAAAPELSTARSTALLPLARPPVSTGGCSVAELVLQRERQVLQPGEPGGSIFFDASDPSSWEGYATAVNATRWEDEPQWRDDWLQASLQNRSSGAVALPLPPGLAASTSPFLDDLTAPSTFTLRKAAGWPLMEWNTGLQRYTRYRLYTRARTLAGWGPPSEAVQVQTSAQKATPPRDVALVPEWRTAVQLGVRFRPPADTGGPPVFNYFRSLLINGVQQNTYFTVSTRQATANQTAAWSPPGSPQTWFVANVTGLTWSTNYTIRLFAGTTLQGNFSNAVSSRTDDPKPCVPQCVPMLGACHPWNGICGCSAGWEGADCSGVKGEPLVLRLRVARGSTALLGISQASGAPASPYPDVPLATAALSSDLGLASSASPAAKEAAISALLGPGTPVALAGNAIGSLFRQLAAAAGIDSSLQPRLALRSARLTDLEAVQAAPSSPGSVATAVLTVLVAVAPLSSLPVEQQASLSAAARASESDIVATLAAAAAANAPAVRGMGVMELARPAGLGTAAAGSVTSVAAPGCRAEGESPVSCADCLADQACSYCPTRDACAPGTPTEFGFGSVTCPVLTPSGGTTGSGPLDLLPESKAQYFNALAATALPVSSSQCLPSCSALSGCDSCTVRADCRFCRSSQKCSSVHALGLVDTPRVGNGACPQASIADDKRICPSQRCPTRSGSVRSHCLDDSMCGWCGPTRSDVVAAGSCMEGNSFGPISGQCTQSWFFRRELSCLDLGEAALVLDDGEDPLAPAAIPATICAGCTGQQLGCGYCNSTGSCVSASDDGTAPALGSCSSGWVGPGSGTSKPVCPARPLSRKEQCAALTQCGDCQASAFCSWCDLGNNGQGTCLLDAAKPTGGAMDVASSSCSAIATLGQLTRHTCISRCSASSATRIVQLSGTVSQGSASPATAAEARALAVASLRRARVLTAARASASNASSPDSQGIDVSYSSGQVCSWVIDPRPLTSTIKSVSGGGSGQSSSTGEVVYETTTLPTLYAVIEAVDLAIGDSLELVDGSSATAGRPMLVITGSSLAGAEGRANELNVAWAQGYVEVTQADGDGVPSGGLLVAAATTGAITVTLRGAGAATAGSLRALSTSIETTRGGAGEQGLPLGFRMSFTARENRPLDVYFVVGLTVVVFGLGCMGFLVGRRIRRRMIRRRQIEFGFDVEVDNESFDEAATRARQEGSATPAVVVAMLPAFVFRSALVDQTPLVGTAPDDLVCPITLDPFEDGVTVIRLLPCKHAFARQGVDNWLKLNRVCPLCKADVVDGHVARLSAVESGLPDPLKVGPDVEMVEGGRLAAVRRAPPAAAESLEYSDTESDSEDGDPAAAHSRAGTDDDPASIDSADSDGSTGAQASAKRDRAASSAGLLGGGQSDGLRNPLTRWPRLGTLGP
ncbi:hypothetical protein FNF29_06318 [Cafeteria roenbergensis]|uniref:RING-type domain-containing protein n=1 Tax=Cafeteria roenbergensis TaxID=33653 RepID=A0A5A8C8P3_CAFRO|nr:hypothetical protein FNF29_06318 [Cafeteria roenbergensis]|eukprot:KAA0149027.1 hypothetical protein FNF29_06318 [Cafeteria roenbergensis]